MLVLRQVRLPRAAPGATADVVIERGCITAIEPGGTVALGAGPHEAVDASGLLALPGLVNAHVHSNESFERGLLDKLPLERWHARAYPPFGLPAVPPRWHYLRAMLVACDAIRSGVTALQDDFLNPGCDMAALDGVMQAYTDAGLRAQVATTLGDRRYLDGLPFARALCPPALRDTLDATSPLPLATQVAFFESAVARWHGQAGGRLRIMLGPRGPQRCSPPLLQQVAALSTHHGSAVHMHVLETRTQAVAAEQQHGSSFIEVLAGAGLLNERLTLNHAIWLGSADIDALARAGCSVTHNPLSNDKLGSGTCQVQALRAAGVKVALGSDGPATGDTADMVQVLRAASLRHRTASVPADAWIGPQEAFEMATQGGAASMQLAPGSGTLAVGAPADLMLLDLRHRAFIPLHDAVAQLTLSASSEAVHSVIADGRLLMHARRILAFDEDAILDEARVAAEQFRQAFVPRMHASGARLDPLLQAVHARVWAEAPPSRAAWPTH